MFAATACADAVGVKSIAITNAVSTVVLSLSKTSSSFPWEHGWIRMDAGELYFITFRDSFAKRNVTKKNGGAEAPPLELNRFRFCLVRVLLASGRATADTLARRRRITRAGARIGDDDCQIAHGEVTCTNIADERKAVSVLEVANREHVALEARGDGLQSVGPHRAGGYVARVAGSRRSGRSGGGAAVVGQRATARLCTGDVAAHGERIHRGIRHRQTGVEAGLIGDVRIQQDGTADANREDIGCRGSTREARNWQAGRSRAGRCRRSEAQGERRSSGQRGILRDVGCVGGVDRELEAFNRVRVGVHHFPYRDRKSTRLNSSHLGISYAV